MKFSNYNVFTLNHDSLYILNTLHGNFAKINVGVDEIYSAMKGVGKIPDCHLEFMMKNNFIIENNVNEYEECIKFSQQIIKGNDLLNLIILPTERCNFNCVYCYEYHDGESLTDEYADLVIKFVERHIKGKKGLNVSWFGGEPLVNLAMVRKLSLKLLELCHNYKISYTADMTTNGYLLDLKTINELKKMHIYRYQITIDGFSNTHNEQRILQGGGGTWNRIIKNLEDIRDGMHSGIMQFVIRTNVCRKIYEEYEDFIDFLDNHFGQDARFRFLIRKVSDWGNIDDTVKDTFVSDSEYEEILQYALKKRMFNVAMQMSITPGGNLCYAWKDNCYIIRANGNIGKCTVLIDDDVNQIGHIAQLSINNKFWVHDIKNAPENCLKCKKYPICLKVKCKMPGSGECDNVVKNIEKYLPLIADKRYGCIFYGGTE